MKRYLTEFVGTFLLVLAIGCSVVPAPSPIIPPLAIGAALTALVYAGGPVSGAHYNPAVTVAFWMRGRFAAKEIVPYWIAQVTAAVAAAMITSQLVGPGASMSIDSVPRALLAELLFTFALAWVILKVATAKATEGNSYYGVAIGAVVTAGIFAVGDTSGAAFNPAVAVAIGVMKIVDLSQVWIHLLGTFAGAAGAAWIFRLTHRDE